MKVQITKLIRGLNPDTIWVIKGFAFALIVAAVPLLLLFALLHGGGCYWNDGGTCPLCGW